MTAKTGLDQRDLSAMWQLVATPGSPTLSRDDFSLFMHPAAPRQRRSTSRVDASRRPGSLAGRERATRRTTRRTTVDDPSNDPSSPSKHQPTHRGRRGDFGGIKDGSKLANMHVAGAGGRGRRAAGPATAPMGAATAKRDGRVVFDAPVTTRATHGSLPPGAAMLFELRHFKAKEKKMSVKCWAFAPAEDIAPGARGEYPTLTKPTDPTRKKTRRFNKGAPDVRVRFA